jgi:2-phospho-L-lactate guanylyltransferase (CobY/MobA/RfbA family)
MKLKNIKEKYKMKLVRMLPFLENAELKELVDSILNDQLDKDSISIIEVVPFLEDEEINRLFNGAIEGKIDVNPVAFLPFLENEAMNELVDRIQSGEITNVKIESIIPFLEKEQIQKIFRDTLNSMKKKE